MKTQVQESSIQNWHGGMYAKASTQAQVVLGLMKPGVEYTGREMVEMLQGMNYRWAVPGTVSRIFESLRTMPCSLVKRYDMKRKCTVTGVRVDVHVVELPEQKALFQ
jgi:hypothetical protein